MGEIDKRIILHLAYNPHSANKIIADKTGVSESTASKRLNKLKEKDIVDYKTCPTREGKNYAGKCWYIIDDPAAFEYSMYNFVMTEQMAYFLQSPYVQNLDIHGLKIDRLIIGAITNHLNGAEWMWNLLYQHPKLTEQLIAAIEADTSNNTAAKLLYQTQEMAVLINYVIPRLRDLLSNLPHFYDAVISPAIRSDSSALSDIDRSELRAILEKDMETLLSKNKQKSTDSPTHE